MGHSSRGMWFDRLTTNGKVGLDRIEGKIDPFALSLSKSLSEQTRGIYRIDGSRPACDFRLVAFPNQWRKANVGVGREPGTSERQEKYRGFFQDLIEQLREQHSFTGSRKGQPQSFYSFSSGFQGVRYGSSFAQNQKIRVELYIDREKEWNEGVYDKLHVMKLVVESELGERLE